MSYLVVNRIAAYVTALGFGSRLAVWVQGCNIGCPGCCSIDTWSGAGRRLAVQAIIDWALQNQPDLDGVSISGGEASLQANAVTELIHAFREAYCAAEVDVLLFSGLPYAHLKRRYKALAETADAICSGPYVASLPPLPLRGSSNQTLHLQTELARRRYADVDTWPIHRMQAAFNKEHIVTVGIPNQAGLNRLLSLESFDPRTASWTTEGVLP